MVQALDDPEPWGMGCSRPGAIRKFLHLANFLPDIRRYLVTSIVWVIPAIDVAQYSPAGDASGDAPAHPKRRTKFRRFDLWNVTARAAST